jgi:hypothetical protein
VARRRGRMIVRAAGKTQLLTTEQLLTFTRR